MAAMTEHKARIVILSDTHMGRPRASVRRPEMLRPLWRGASSLVINGDAAEIHNPHYRVHAAEQVLRLHDLCELDGVELKMLSGNHDPYISDVRHLLLADGRVFVTHGDVLHPAIAPWCATAARVRAAHDRAMARLEPETRRQLATRLSVSQHASNEHWTDFQKALMRPVTGEVARRPWMVLRVLWYWLSVPKLAADFAAEHAPDARFFVFGHTHRQGVWRRGGLTFINTGSFDFPGRPRAVVIENRQLSVHAILRRGDAFRFNERPLTRLDLDAPPRQDG